MKKCVVIITILIIFILVGAFFFLKGLEDDKKQTALVAKRVNSNYSKFNENISSFSKQRESLYKSLEDTYLEEFAANFETFNKLISDYEKIVLDLEESSKNLKKDCKYRFSDVLANSNCTNFKANYEAAMNYYITDAKYYNKLANKYNSWVKSNGYDYGKLEKAKFVVYKKYIDFDDDGEFFGSEDVK